MQWKVKAPKNAAVRVSKMFLLWPYRIDDTMYWLRTIYIVEEWRDFAEGWLTLFYSPTAPTLERIEEAQKKRWFL